MKNFKKITLGILPVFLFFGAMAQNEGQQQGQFQQQEQNENQTQQMQQDQELQDMDQRHDRMQAQFEDFNEPQTFSGEDLEEALLAAGNLRNWDNSGDGKFDAAEFYVVLFHIWDRNHDGKLDQDEWEYGTNNFLSEYKQDEFGDFKKWDDDKSNELDINEFARGIENAELYNSSPRLLSNEQGQSMEQKGELDQDADQEITMRQDETDTEVGQDKDLDTDDDTTSYLQQEQEQANITRQGQSNRQNGQYQAQKNDKPSIVIWQRRGAVEKIAIGDRTISLSENVGRTNDYENINDREQRK